MNGECTPWGWLSTCKASSPRLLYLKFLAQYKVINCWHTARKRNRKKKIKHRGLLIGMQALCFFKWKDSNDKALKRAVPLFLVCFRVRDCEIKKDQGSEGIELNLSECISGEYSFFHLNFKRWDEGCDWLHYIRLPTCCLCPLLMGVMRRYATMLTCCGKCVRLRDPGGAER